MEYKITKGDEVEIDVTIPWSDAEVEFDKLMDDVGEGKTNATKK